MPRPKCQYHSIAACPDCGELLCVPNWFDRKDVESLIGKKISRKAFDKLREHVELILADEVSESVRDVVLEYLKNKE
jgi:predicted Fe-Mo cluster-binding NifX family protein